MSASKSGILVRSSGLITDVIAGCLAFIQTLSVKGSIEAVKKDDEYGGYKIYFSNPEIAVEISKIKILKLAGLQTPCYPLTTQLKVHSAQPACSDTFKNELRLEMSKIAPVLEIKKVPVSDEFPDIGNGDWKVILDVPEIDDLDIFTSNGLPNMIVKLPSLGEKLRVTFSCCLSENDGNSTKICSHKHFDAYPTSSVNDKPNQNGVNLGKKTSSSPMSSSEPSTTTLIEEENSDEAKISALSESLLKKIEVDNSATEKKVKNSDAIVKEGGNVVNNKSFVTASSNQNIGLFANRHFLDDEESFTESENLVIAEEEQNEMETCAKNSGKSQQQNVATSNAEKAVIDSTEQLKIPEQNLSRGGTTMSHRNNNTLDMYDPHGLNHPEADNRQTSSPNDSDKEAIHPFQLVKVKIEPDADYETYNKRYLEEAEEPGPSKRFNDGSSYTSESRESFETSSSSEVRGGSSRRSTLRKRIKKEVTSTTTGSDILQSWCRDVGVSSSQLEELKAEIKAEMEAAYVDDDLDHDPNYKCKKRKPYNKKKSPQILPVVIPLKIREIVIRNQDQGVVDVNSLEAFLNHVKKKSCPAKIAAQYTTDVAGMKAQLESIKREFYKTPDISLAEESVFMKWFESLIERFDGLPAKRRPKY